VHYVYKSQGPRSSRLPKTSLQFVTTVAYEDHKACERFMKTNPEIWDELSDSKRYIAEAIDLFAEGDPASKKTAKSCLEKCVISDMSKEFRPRSGVFKYLIARDKNTMRDFDEDLDKLLKYCKEQASKRPQPARESARRERQPSTLPAAMANLNIAPSTYYRPEIVSSGSTPPAARHGPVPVARPETIDEGTESGRSDADPNPRTRYAVNRPPRAQGNSISQSQDSTLQNPVRDHGDDREAQPRNLRLSFSGDRTTNLDPRFQRIPDHQWDSYFKIGRVFAIMTHNEDTSGRGDDDFSRWKVKNKLGQVVWTEVRRMVIIGRGHGFCWAIPINTYGGQGLSKRSLGASNRNAHAIIHMEGQDPKWLPGEPKSAKDAIEVRPYDKSQTLVQASRINFEKNHTVELNVKIMKIGMVTERCIPYLSTYFKLEYERIAQSGQEK
jgi:hypothetical protein